MDYIAKAKRVLSLEITELQRLHDRIDDSFVEAINLLCESVAQHSKIVIAGIGKSGNIGNKLAATFNSTGAPAVVLNCQDALHGDLGLLDTGDTVLAMSYSGETSELLNVISHIKRRDVKIIAITGNPSSSLAKRADCILNVEVEREACPLNLAPTSSTTNTLALGDALAMVLLEARGFQKENFAELHPSGTLGHILLTKAEDIMRKDNEMVCVTEGELIRNVLHKMTNARTGAAVVIDGAGCLDGIFTQGDFTRAFQNADGEDIGSKTVGAYMTKNPIAVSSDQLVGEVLNLLETNRIDDLVVLNSDSKPVGIIDTQDMSRLRVV